MRILRQAHKAWSTWGIALMTTLAYARADLMPWIEPHMHPDTFSKIVLGVGVVVFVLRFIDQGLSDA